MWLKISHFLGLTNLGDEQVSEYYNRVAILYKDPIVNQQKSLSTGAFIGWKRKFIFLLIVYFAGFATAIYVLLPSENNKSSNSNQDVVKLYGSSRLSEFVKNFNVGVHKALDTTKEIVGSLINKLKGKTKESKPSDSNKLEGLKAVEEKKKLQDANQ